MTHIIDIEGIGKVYAEKLESIGIKTVEKLLEKGGHSFGEKRNCRCHRG